MDSRTATAEFSSRSVAATTFHDFDELLLGPSDLEALPFEFGCDFASAFDGKQVEVDAPAPSHRPTGALLSCSSSSMPRPKEAKRSHKRKSDALTSATLVAPRSLPVLSSTALLGGDQDDLSSLDPLANGSTQIGRWTKKEHELFLEGLRLYGKSWKKISSLVVTRTLVQIRTHAQKYLQKQTKSALKAAAAAAAAATGNALPSSSGASSSSAKSRKVASHQLTGDATQTAWKHYHSHAHQHNVFLPIAFPDQVPGSSSSSSSNSIPSSSFCTPPAVYPVRKDLGSHSMSSMSKLDQLLHDDAHTSAGSDEYYSSPTGSDDDLVQWLQHRHLPFHATGSSPAAKRRRMEVSGGLSNAWAIVNPMEAIAAHNSASHASYYGHHGQHLASTSTEFLLPLSAYAGSSSTMTNHHDSEFTFGTSWL